MDFTLHEFHHNFLKTEDIKAPYIHPGRQWHPTPVLLPGKSHRRRSLVGCPLWGRTESKRLSSSSSSSSSSSPTLRSCPYYYELLKTESPSYVSSQLQGLGQETKSTALGPERQGKVCCLLAHNPTMPKRQGQGPLGGHLQGLPSVHDHHQLETVCAWSCLTL